MASAPATLSVTERVRQRALVLGFDAVAVARADVPLDVDYERYQQFIRAGMHGEMEWLANHAEARRSLDSERILSGARSIVCVARSYARPLSAEKEDPPLAQALARYARGKDYHAFLRRKVRRLAAFLRTLGTPESPVRARPLCDEEPILERAWAARSGLGFVGKNGIVIIPGLGSMVLLGEVVTTLELEPDAPIGERCGACTRCVDACPTGAFVRPFVLDARRCISYMTIEKGSPVVAEERPALGAHLFGCDDCQTVCPFNAATRAAKTGAEAGPFAPLERWKTTSLADLVTVDLAQWNAVSQGSPLRRAGRVHAARCAAIVLANRRDSSALPALRRAAQDHDDATVRETATWAIASIVAGLLPQPACVVPLCE
ncbi:MAG: tRNA epoxyqueuosine(34) reductase QueG [Polyangiaceae bacterium]|jgi:epoxyqueuosine reductase